MNKPCETIAGCTKYIEDVKKLATLVTEIRTIAIHGLDEDGTLTKIINKIDDVLDKNDPGKRALKLRLSVMDGKNDQ